MHNLIRFFIFIFLTWLALTLVATGNAEEMNDRTLSPYFMVENGDPSLDRFPLKATHVAVTINGVIADITVTQKYTNDGTRPINARYVFPASTRAAVHGMQMIIGTHVIKAKIKERGAAKKTFNQAKRDGKSASLLEQQRPNVFSMNVANIIPGDTVDIELQYTELIVPTEGTYEFVYPTVVGPRYGTQPEADAPETDRWVKNPYLEQGNPTPTAFNISLTISTGMALQEIVCKSHAIETLWEGESIARLSLTEDEGSGGDRDFIVNYRLTGKQIQSGLMLFEGQEENFFLLMVEPPERVQPADIPPREYIFVVDVSGSMNGFPLNTAKKLLTNLIGSLRPTDKFNVILFAGSSRAMAPASLPANSKNVSRAVNIIERQRGGGGTELLAGLQKGIGLPWDEGFSRTIIVVTDGFIAAERDVFETIRNNLNQINVFAFGIGSSVNRFLIEGMAKAGQGEPFVVTEPGEARAAAEQFRQYIQSPVLTGITVNYDGFKTYDIEPAGIPDLFAQRPVIAFGKWRGQPDGTIELTGTNGNGRYVQTFAVSAKTPLAINKALPYLWARTRISRLSDFNFNRGAPDDKAEITNLGLTYNLLTAYTSFIAVDEIVRNPEGDSENVKQPLPLPRHVSNLAVGGSVATVPEPGIIFLLGLGVLIGCLLVISKKLGAAVKTMRR